MTLERRSTDARLIVLERDVAQVLDTVRAIDSALRFPEQSPVGRALIERADRNAGNITKLRTDVDDLEAKFDELNGVVKALRLVGLLVGIVVSGLTLLQLVNG